MPDVRRRERKTKPPSRGKTNKDGNGIRPGSSISQHRYVLPISTIIIVLLVLFLTRSLNGKRPQQTSDADSSPSAPNTSTLNASPFVVTDLPGRGKGLVATRDIKQGELVLREMPLFVVPSKITSSPAALIAELVDQLNETARKAFFELSYVNLPEHLDPHKHRDEVALAIFQTNAVAAGSNGVGIFPRMARLNHGCSGAFNMVCSWREKEQALFIHALKDVRRGEELLTTYTDSKKSRHQRRDFLKAMYGFDCQCSVCSLPDRESQASDKRLENIAKAYDRFRTWAQRQITGREAIQLVLNIWKLEDDEGYWSERGRLAADAAWIAAAHSDAGATRKWAEVALEWYSYELGADSEQADEMRQLAWRPEGHRAWGTRERMMISTLR